MRAGLGATILPKAMVPLGLVLLGPEHDLPTPDAEIVLYRALGVLPRAEILAKRIVHLLEMAAPSASGAGTAREGVRWLCDWVRPLIGSRAMWEDVILFAAVGFAAQVIDGALGMAYGVTASTVLQSLGVAPSVASASVHAAEVFTTGASGAAHWRLGNVDRVLLRRLATSGVAGGAIGAFLLTTLPGSIIRPFVSAYLLIMGLLILWRAVRQRAEDAGAQAFESTPGRVAPLGLAGGFLDAIGGGGWGALVTSTLIGRGVTPRLAIGSANLASSLSPAWSRPPFWPPSG